MKPEVTHHEDGSVTIQVRKLTKTIIDSTTKKLMTLISYDGVSWRMEENGWQEVRRLRAASNLHPGSEDQKNKAFDAVRNPGTPEKPPEILALEHHESPILGKDKGRKHKHQRALRAKKAVIVPRPVHFHKCRGKKHPYKFNREKQFSCSCEHRFSRRFCGGTICLYDLDLTELAKENIDNASN